MSANNALLRSVPYTPSYKGLKQALESEWTLPATIKYDHLLHHFILYWSKEYFQKQYDPATRTIYKEGRLYKVIFHKCTLQDCSEIASTQQVALSFRVPHTRHGLNPVVLVSCSPRNLIRK